MSVEAGTRTERIRFKHVPLRERTAHWGTGVGVDNCITAGQSEEANPTCSRSIDRSSESISLRNLYSQLRCISRSLKFARLRLIKTGLPKMTRVEIASSSRYLRSQ
jgi:hypothetical protein